MSNSNKHIEEFLDYYLNVEQSPDYAVLITGCWGSGKTYFIRQYLGGNRKEVKEWLTDCEKYVVVYVSLFGAKSREEMDKRVLETLHPKLNSKIVKAIPGAVSLIGKIVGTATANPFETIAGENIAVFSENVLEAEKKDLKKVVVVFDDVERADMPLPELLGYLNEYVEHLHVPCILLADKDKWEEAQKCQEDKSTLHHLSSTKEKVIGKEFQIQTSVEDVVNAWLAPKNGCLDVEPNVKKIWWENRESIYDLFACIDNAKEKYLGEMDYSINTSKQSEYDWEQMKKYVAKIPNRNFRALKHTIKDFDNLCSYYCKDFENLLNTPESIERGVRKVFVRHFFKMRYGLMVGMYDASKMHRSSVLKFIDDEKVVENSLTKFDCFEKVLYDANSLDGFPMQEWLLNGCFDRKKTIEKINASAWFGGYNDYAVRRFYHWWSLSDKEATESYQILKKCINEGTISNPNALVYIFVVLFIISNDKMSSLSKDDVVKMMNKYVDDYSDKIIPEKIDDFSAIEMSFPDIETYQETLIPFRNRLVKLVMEKSHNQREEQERKFICDLQKGYSKEFHDALALISNDSNNMFFRFSDINIVKFIKILRKISRLCREDVVERVKERYLIIINKNKNDLQKEKKFLISLKKECEKFTQRSEEVLLPSIFSLRELIKIINESLTKIEKREKENAT